MFVKEVTKIILENGGVVISKEEGGFAPLTRFRLPLKDNGIEITLHDESDHAILYSVFMRFDKLKESLDMQYNTKHNFHTNGSVIDVVMDFETFLKNAIEK